MFEEPQPKKPQENLLFLKRLIQNPRALGAVMPSSKSLAREMARHVLQDTPGYIVELGPGTGPVTHELMKRVHDPKRLILVELDLELYAYIKSRFPHVRVVHGDARHLSEVLPAEVVGHVDCIVSGIPMVNLPLKVQSEIVSSCLDVMADQGKILQFSYRPISPLPAHKLDLSVKMVGHVLRNMPPATLWEYQRRSDSQTQPESVIMKEFMRKFFSLKNPA